MFRKPKKPIQRRVFSSYDDADEKPEDSETANEYRMDVDEPNSLLSRSKPKKSSMDGAKDINSKTAKKPSLLSFAEEEGTEMHNLIKHSFTIICKSVIFC